MVTDFFGNIFRFVTDSTITVETLPKYGRLFVASTAAEASAGTTAELRTADGYDRFTGAFQAVGGGYCGGITRPCPNVFSTGSGYPTRTLGAVAARNQVQPPSSGGGLARIWYIPEQDYLGPDDFSFSVSIGDIKSKEAWVAGVHTRR